MHDLRTHLAELSRHSLARTGMGIISGLLLLGFLAPWLAFYSPEATGGQPLSPPGGGYILGTNALGQDIFSQVLYGCRASLLVGLSVGLGSTFLGFVVGTLAGYYPRVAGVVLMRLVDVLMTIPRLPLIVLLAVFLKPSLVNVILVLLLLTWPGIARTVRSYVISLKERDYLKYVSFSGGGFLYMLRRHLLQELLPLLVAKTVSAASFAIAAEAGLSFLGLGDPTVKSWGVIMRSALDYPGILWTDAWMWWFLPPAVMVSLAVLGFTLTGYTLEEHFSPGKAAFRYED